MSGGAQVVQGKIFVWGGGGPNAAAEAAAKPVPGVPDMAMTEDIPTTTAQGAPAYAALPVRDKRVRKELNREDTKQSYVSCLAHQLAVPCPHAGCQGWHGLWPPQHFLVPVRPQMVRSNVLCRTTIESCPTAGRC